MTYPDPARTLVLLVAVERYEAGPEWDLDGPVSDAIKLARWVLEQGVPRANVRCLMSPLPRNQIAIDDLGLEVEPAQLAMVNDVVTRYLATTSCELLLIAWGGHGVMEGRHRRRLFTADAAKQDLRNVDLTRLLDSLGSTFVPEHDRQLVLVDACQTYTYQLGMTGQLPEYAPPAPNDLASGRLQEVLLAASPGQTAWNSRPRRSGVFSTFVLDGLRTYGWPPTVTNLEPYVREALAAATLPEGQMPYLLWSRGPQREGAIVISKGPVGSMRRLEAGQIKELQDAFLAVDELADSGARSLVVQSLPRDIRGGIVGSGARTEFLSWIRTCDGYHGGRVALRDSVSPVVGRGAAASALLALLDRPWPSELLDPTE